MDLSQQQRPLILEELEKYKKERTSAEEEAGKRPDLFGAKDAFSSFGSLSCSGPIRDIVWYSVFKLVETPIFLEVESWPIWAVLV